MTVYEKYISLQQKYFESLLTFNLLSECYCYAKKTIKIAQDLSYFGDKWQHVKCASISNAKNLLMKLI